jgi:hypothetical protein
MPVPSVSNTKSAHALAAAEGVLAERRAARVVADEHRELERGADVLAERHVLPAEIRRVADRAGFEIDVAGRADADAHDGLFLRVGERFADDGFDAREHGVRRVVDDVALVLLLGRARLVDDRRHHVRTAEIDTDCLPHASRLRPAAGSIRRRRERTPMQETIDLIAHRELRNLRRFTRETGQPTSLEQLDLEPMTIGSEHRDRRRTHHDQVQRKHRALLQRERALASRVGVQVQRRSRDGARRSGVIELARKHLYDLPGNVACPPGCAECCSGYEPFVSKADVQRHRRSLRLHLRRNAERVRGAARIGRRIQRRLSQESRPRTSRAKCVFLKGRARANTTAACIARGRTTAARSRRSAATTSMTDRLNKRGKYVVGDPFKPKRRKRT